MGAAEIAEALKINSTLTHLSFGCSNFSITSSNSIEDGGAKAIAKALKTNNTLTYLNLNSIGDQGLIELEVALVINTTLIYLDVGWNREKNTGYYAKQEIKKYIQRNKNIAEKKAETLNAEGNNLCSQGKYSDAIEKYTVAIKIMKSLHKENKCRSKSRCYNPLLNHLKFLQEACPNPLNSYAACKFCCIKNYRHLGGGKSFTCLHQISSDFLTILKFL